MKKPKPTAAERLAQKAQQRIQEPSVKPEPIKHERKEVQMREVPVVQWVDCYNSGWRDLIVPEAFAH